MADKTVEGQFGNTQTEPRRMLGHGEELNRIVLSPIPVNLGA